MREPKAVITNIIGKGTSINGKLKVEGSIHIDGIVDGNIEITESIIIGKSGIVNGEIHTKDGLIGGKINGNLFANGRLEFKSGSILIGDMRCKQLVIEEGVIFDGNCKMRGDTSSEKAATEAKQLIKSTTPIFTPRSHESKSQPSPEGMLPKAEK
ncbi:MAG: polymer-forming cytoskeletal protein [bacterium]|nr:polymer-forming cytoskeletal protein [bacterium]